MIAAMASVALENAELRASPVPHVTSDLDQRLRREPIIWIGSTRPDGRPHLLPIWFTWDGSAVWIFSRPHAQKIWNLRWTPSVMLALGTADPHFDVELLEGQAELITAPTTAVMPTGHVAKYAAQLAEAGLTAATYAQRFSQPVRIRVTRVLDWRRREQHTRHFWLESWAAP